MSRTARAYVVVGGICGLTWSAGFRGWMAELARGDSHSTVTWMTLALVLAPGTAIGVLLGWSAYLRSTRTAGPRWLVFSPVLFAAALLDPEIFHGLVTDGTGGGALIVVATALSVGDAIGRRGWSWRRVAGAVLGGFGLLVLFGMGGMAAPTSTPRGLWVCIYGFVFVLLLGFASALSHPPAGRRLGIASWIGLGALVGLAWACALREFMAQVAGAESGVDWDLTFGFILLPGLLIGAMLGWAEHRRRAGRRPGWPFVVAPMLFAAVLFSDPLHLGELFDNGIGGGTVGVPAIAMLGGYAVFGRGRRWRRLVSGLLFLTGFTIWLLVATDVGGPSFSLGTVHGIWVSTMYESLLVVFALGAGVPHRRPWADRPQVAPINRVVEGVPS